MNDKKAQTRERILQAASAALIQRGPAEPSVGEVMGAAGLTVGGFYAHFESKDALMLEAFTELLARRRAAVEDMDSTLTGEERRTGMQARRAEMREKRQERRQAAPAASPSTPASE